MENVKCIYSSNLYLDTQQTLYDVSPHCDATTTKQPVTISNWLIAVCISSRTSPRLLCTATQQKNGHGSEEEADKPEQSSAEKVLVEEKSQLEEQLKDMTVCLQRESYNSSWNIVWMVVTMDYIFFFVTFQEKYKRALADTENLRTRSQKMVEDAKLYGN